ncbi:MAG: DNA-directed RNA polymerase subunit alpha [Actinomycetia bacterium]|nr:DNA-directed RNA polymerase subunit alpha [Actinomycetes bacterium]
MAEFMRPTVAVDQIDDRVARYVVEPLDRGFGYTLGNCMRRVLLSSLEGAAATSIAIDGVQHEFSSIKGVREDVTDIVLNVKGLVFADTGIGEGEAIATLNVKGDRVVTGADFEIPNEFELINPDHVIAHLNKNGKLSMTMHIGTGRGYVSAEGNKAAHSEIGAIAVDSLFSPVIRCTYFVDNTRVGQRTDFEKLTLEVETNGSCEPNDAIARAGRIINEHMQLFVEQTINPMDEESIFVEIDETDTGRLDTPIGDLHLSVRAYNCLMRQGVSTVGQLVECTENDLMNVRNFGAKSIEEVKDKLAEMGLSLKA